MIDLKEIKLFTMAVKILMPALSPTMEEGSVANWLKKEGDTVEAGEVVAEIQTDKSIMEVEALDEGTIAKIVVAAGTSNVKVNDLIAIIAEEGENKEDAINQIQNNAKSINIKLDKKILEPDKKSIENNHKKNHQDNQKDKSNRIFISPLAKRIANQENIDTSKIKGSGPKGRIVTSDLGNIAPRQSSRHYLPSFALKQDIEIPINNMRRIIAKRLVESKQQVPHFYLEVECIVDKLLKIRTEVNSSAKHFNNGTPEFKISINDMLIKASALSLAKHPKVNAAWYEDKIIQFSNIDIVVAVAIEDGLLTPIVKNANQKGLIQISGEVKELVKKAKSQKLIPEEYQGGSFSISNLGMYSINSFYAIINSPQSCILAIGKIKAVPVFNDDGDLEKRQVMNISLSCDHRVIDGVTAAIFLNTIKEFVESPYLMLCY